MINKVYYINLEHRLDRKEHIEKLLDESGLLSISERINAISHVAGQIGCIMSHILTLEKFIESNEEYCLILEDDFSSDNSESLKLDIKKIFDDNIDFDIIQILGNHITLGDSVSGYLKKVIESQTTSGYIVNKKFVNTLLDNFRESLILISTYGVSHDFCLDQYWKRLQPISKWYCFYPALGYQMDGYSDILNTDVSYKC